MFVSIHHRQLPLFDKGIDLLRSDGFFVFILNNENDNYDNGVAKIADLVRNMEWDIIHFVDNDCFISDTTYIKQTLKDFADSPLGFVSYFENGYGNDYTKYKFKGTIAEVKNQTFIKKYPFMKPSWENAMMMFKREAWKQITDFSTMEKIIPELWGKGVRFGVKKVEPRLRFSHKGEGFFHMGNLMKYYYMLVNDEEIPIDEISKARIGYFQHDGIMPDKTNKYEDYRKEFYELSK